MLGQDTILIQKQGQPLVRREHFPRVLIEAFSYLTIFSFRLDTQSPRGCRVEHSLFPKHYLTFLLVLTHNLFKLLWISLKESPVPGHSLTLSSYTHKRTIKRASTEQKQTYPFQSQSFRNVHAL